MRNLMKRKMYSGKRLKFSEWRPIGVCDGASPGRQMAQMFTREDFLTVTGPGISRDNWRNSADVMRVLDHYARELMKISSLTLAMRKPGVSRISLVGTIMHLSLAPHLSKESKDGKLQFFMIEFKDRAVANGRQKRGKKIGRKLWILFVALLSLATAALIAALFFKVAVRQSQPDLSRFPKRTYTGIFCKIPGNAALYMRHLDEALGILQFQIDDLYYRAVVAKKPNCIEPLRLTSRKERLFLQCMDVFRRKAKFAEISPEEHRKLIGCRSRICGMDSYREDPVCIESY